MTRSANLSGVPSSSTSRSGGPFGSDATAGFLLRLVDIGLAGVIFVAPLFMGGRYDVGRLAYVATVCFMSLCWATRQCVISDARWRWSGAEVLLVAGLLLILLQLTPLPQSVLLTLSPEIGELLSLWTSEGGAAAQLGTWSQLTLTPEATRCGLVMFLAHVMLFLVVVQRIRDFHDIERLMRWLAMAAIGMALLGLAQFLFSNGKFLWVYEHPFRDTGDKVKGPFQNQNHFAHFLALGIGPLIWWLVCLWASHARKKPTFGSVGGSPERAELLKHGLTIGLGLVAFAGLLTFSRGGVVGMFTAAVVCLGLLVWKGLLGKRSVITVGGLALLLVGALAIHGYEPLARRLSTLRDSRSLEELSRGRQVLWAADLTAIPKFPLTGTGAGSHRQVYRTYLEEHFNVDFTHAENGYIHLMLENGFTGLALMLCAAGLMFYWCIRTLVFGELKAESGRAGEQKRSPPLSNAKASACAAALLAGLAASMIHSFGDFVWYIPACMSLTIVIAACACRLYQMSVSSLDGLRSRSHATTGAAQMRVRTSAGSAVASSLGVVASILKRVFDRDVETRLSRLAWVAATVGLFGAAGTMLQNRIPPALAASHWDEYFELSRASRAMRAEDAKDAPRQIAAMTSHLEELLRLNPDDARANLRLAGLYLRSFDIKQKASENPMPLSQIRDAALASPFSSREEQNGWLAVVLGENRSYLDRAMYHAKQGLRLCPLQGEGYVHLAELAFLDSSSAQLKHAYVDQALRVRPHEGVVLFAAGGEAALAGDITRALELWKRAFHQAPDQQTRIIELLAPQMPADAFSQHFEPDLPATGRLYWFYRKNNQIEQARCVGTNYAAMLESEAMHQTGAEAAAKWDEARSVHDFLGNQEKALDCARNAVAQAPDDFAKHRILASALMRRGLYDEAIRELQWCSSRQPDDGSLQRMLQTAGRERILKKDTKLR